MTFINYAAREINCKIVYYGPGLCGKTTNLQYIYEKTNPQAKGQLISLATETDRTLFFDFRYRGIRCREYTSLADSPANRKKLQKVLDRIEADIATGSFDYRRYFPSSALAARFPPAE
mgnify:CR=1 FL=1